MHIFLISADVTSIIICQRQSTQNIIEQDIIKYMKQYSNTFALQKRVRNRKNSGESITWVTKTNVQKTNKIPKVNFTYQQSEPAIVVYNASQSSQSQFSTNAVAIFTKIQYQRVNEAPRAVYYGRGLTIYYKYYIDELNKEVYFYAFRGMMRNNNQRIAQKPSEIELIKHNQFQRESVKIVPLHIAKLEFN